MDEVALRGLLRQVLLASLSVPLAAGASACGGRSVEIAGGDAGSDGAEDSQANGDSPTQIDVATQDTSVPGCENQACGGDCAVGCTPTRTCDNGVLVCSCVCELDSSVVDVSVVDATDPCNPPQNACPYYIPLTCTDASVPEDGAPIPNDECMQICHLTTQPFVPCSLATDPNTGQPAVTCYAMCAIGRRPAGLAAPASRRPRTAALGEHDVLGRYFAEAAHLEAASVGAFRALRRELLAHGAPRALVRAAERAVADEKRHARVTGTTARRFGARAPKPRVRSRKVRPLEAIALENAVEGCVRETFGALTALHQAEAAGDPEVRAMMARIAEDETRHALLGWQVAAWVESRLDAPARTRVAAARRRAVRELRAEAALEPPAELRGTAGLPGAARSRMMLDAMEQALWSDSRP